MFKKNFRLISMTIKSVYLYGNINNLKKLINYFTKEKLSVIFWKISKLKIKDIL